MEGILEPLCLDNVDWKPYYVLSRASLGQIMVSFDKIRHVVPKNNYEEASLETANYM